MQTKIYCCVKITLHFIVMMMISRYIFLIPPLQKKNKSVNPQFLFITCSYLLLLGTCLLFGILPANILLGISIGIYCFLTSTAGKRRYFKILLIFPITGICFGLLMPLVTLPVVILHLSENAEEIYSIIFYAVIGFVLFIFCVTGREWRKDFRNEMCYRKLESWEKVLLYIIGCLMFGFVAGIYAYGKINAENFREIAMLESVVSSLNGFTVTLTIIILILVGNKKAHMHKDLLEMQHNIIITMADIVENRDENTGGHIRRTAKYVEIIAETLLEKGWYQSILNQQYINNMVIAAPLHDIGKIHVPDLILKKQGKLTDKEYAIMKSHTVEGRKLLLNAEKTLGHFDYLDIAVEMAYGHHEWWNGKGYPQGITKHNIPLSARIMAVADVFDAIVSQRCYKGSMTIDEAYEIIKNESGSHFDPIVVEGFLNAREKISEVLRDFEEPLILEKESSHVL
ncbi:MAG: HD-GYP domain-containing protein [Ruminococcus sp.]|nr:HD-GYP domain-containing protein [Ruminococcus sp.]